jgi:hypothetical protein
MSAYFKRFMFWMVIALLLCLAFWGFQYLAPKVAAFVVSLDIPSFSPWVKLIVVIIVICALAAI